MTAFTILKRHPTALTCWASRARKIRKSFSFRSIESNLESAEIVSFLYVHRNSSKAYFLFFLVLLVESNNDRFSAGRTFFYFWFPLLKPGLEDCNCVTCYSEDRDDADEGQNVWPNAWCLVRVDNIYATKLEVGNGTR